MRDDLKAALRSLKSSKTFTTVAVIVLTLGLGAGTAIFSVVDAVVLRGLPFDEHDRLVAVGERRPPIPGRPSVPNRDPDALLGAAPQNYADWATRQQVFESMAAVADGTFVVREPGTVSEELRGMRVTASFFAVLRVQPRLGRAFTTTNETEGRHRVVVLSDGLWMRRFGGDLDVIGRTIPIEGGPFEVVGVMAAEFGYPVGALQSTELWMPYVVPAAERLRQPGAKHMYLHTIARLKAGVSIGEAQAQMDHVSAALTAEHPAWNQDVRAGVRPLRDHFVGGRTTQWMFLLLGAVTTVLLIACANVANLLLVRASARAREVGIRAAMGARRWRLLRQFVIESLALSTIATMLALLLAWWIVGVLKNTMPEGMPRVASIAVDFRVLGVASTLSVIIGLLFGILPALQLSRVELTEALQGRSHGATSSRGGEHIRSGLVVVEVALAVVLLVGAALFIGSFRALMDVEPGFDAENLLTVSVEPRFDITVPNQILDYGPQMQAIVDRVRQAPNVRAAAAVSGGMPFGDGMAFTTLAIPGRVLDNVDPLISARLVTAGYHEALGVPLRAGRYFAVTDRGDVAPVVIVNESAARTFFPGDSAIGESVYIYSAERTIVGVVADTSQRNLETAPRAEAYLPMSQEPRTLTGELVVKTSGDPSAAIPVVKTAALATMPDVLLRNIGTMDELISRMTAPRRFNMLLLGLFGLLGLVIAAVGVYGVMAYVVAQRTREIGVRMALGASRGRVLSMVVANALVLIGTGLVIGGVSAWFLRSAAQAFLFGMDVNDPRAFVSALGVLALAALMATLVPARRAATVDPAITLRAE